MNEKVNSPAHYGGAENPYEAIKVIRAWGLGFALGNALKYLCRAGKKPGELVLDDLRKARWYLDNEIAALEGSRASIAARGEVLSVTASEDSHIVVALQPADALRLISAPMPARAAVLVEVRDTDR